MVFLPRWKGSCTKNVFKSSLMDREFTYHQCYTFKVCDPVGFSTFTELGSYQSSRTLFTSPRRGPPCRASVPYSSPALGSVNLFCLCGSSCPGHFMWTESSTMWPVCLASVTQHVSKVSDAAACVRPVLLLLTNKIRLHRYATSYPLISLSWVVCTFCLFYGCREPRHKRFLCGCRICDSLGLPRSGIAESDGFLKVPT